MRKYKYKRTNFNYLVLLSRHRIECVDIKLEKTKYIYVIHKKDNDIAVFDYLYTKIDYCNNLFYPTDKNIDDFFYIESDYKIREKRLRLYRSRKYDVFQIIPRNSFSCLSCEEYEKMNDEYQIYENNINNNNLTKKENDDYCNIL